MQIEQSISLLVTTLSILVGTITFIIITMFILNLLGRVRDLIVNIIKWFTLRKDIKFAIKELENIVEETKNKSSSPKLEAQKVKKLLPIVTSKSKMSTGEKVKITITKEDIKEHKELADAGFKAGDVVTGTVISKKTAKSKKPTKKSPKKLPF